MIKYVCDWCGKTLEWQEEGPPPGWKSVDYDSNKYTEKIDPAEVCSDECEMRLAEKYASGGLR